MLRPLFEGGVCFYCEPFAAKTREELDAPFAAMRAAGDMVLHHPCPHCAVAAIVYPTLSIQQVAEQRTGARWDWRVDHPARSSMAPTWTCVPVPPLAVLIPRLFSSCAMALSDVMPERLMD
jgi:hypothetical protein